MDRVLGTLIHVVKNVSSISQRGHRPLLALEPCNQIPEYLLTRPPNAPILQQMVPQEFKA
jgi:hypothetical protein